MNTTDRPSIVPALTSTRPAHTGGYAVRAEPEQRPWVVRNWVLCLLGAAVMLIVVCAICYAFGRVPSWLFWTTLAVVGVGMYADARRGR